MKKFILLFVLVYFTVLLAYSQSLSLSYGTDQYNNGDLITYTQSDNVTPMIAYMWVTNNSSNDLKVRARKYEIDTLPGTENYFCWTSCYLSTIYIGDTITIKAGTTNKFNFSGDYDPHGHSGKTRVMYVFYDDANHNDSVAFIAEYNAGSLVGFSSVEKIEAKADVYPNPAKSILNIEYQVPVNANKVTFEIRNILGSIVSQVNLTSTSGKERIDISKLENGVYFYTLIVDEQVVITRKLVIKN